MPVQRYAVVGGGIIGPAVARRLLARRPDAVVTVRLVSRAPGTTVA